MSPNRTSKRRSDWGGDRDEQERVGEGGGAGAGEEQAAAGGGCGAATPLELSAGEAAVEAVSGGRRCGAEASRCGTSVEPRTRGEVSAEGAGAGAGEVQRGGRRAIWTDADNGTLGIGRWREGGGGNAAAVDAGGRVVESGTEEAAAPETARAQGALWRNGAAGRELSPVAGGTWPGRLLDRYGRLRQKHNLGGSGR